MGPEHSIETRVALLEQETINVVERMDAHHDDTKQSIAQLRVTMEAMNQNFITMVSQNADRTARDKMHARMWTAVRHAGTVVASSAITLGLAKWFHVPISMG
jgi:hypothetical protein